MVTTRSEKRTTKAQSVLESPQKVQNGRVTKDRKTDYSRWRMKADNGRQTWHYLRTDEEVKEWPQSDADKYYLGMDLVCLPHCASPTLANRAN